MLEYLRKDGLDNVHGEDVNVTRWLRNQESARLVEPRDYVIAISSLGSSVGTPEEGILAYAIVVRSFDELVARMDEVTGKIVVFNQDYEVHTTPKKAASYTVYNLFNSPSPQGYPKSAIYRVASASRAAEFGAVATLIRSVAPFSIHR